MIKLNPKLVQEKKKKNHRKINMNLEVTEQIVNA